MMQVTVTRRIGSFDPRKDVAKQQCSQLTLGPIHVAARSKVLLHSLLPVLFFELVEDLVPQKHSSGILAQHRQVPEH